MNSGNPGWDGLPQPEQIFFVGRRVRIKLSPECNGYQVARALNDPSVRIGQSGHPAYQDGLVGVISRAPLGLALPGHSLLVVYDEPYEEVREGTRGVHVGGFFAPHELVPLDAEGREVLHPALGRFER